MNYANILYIFPKIAGVLFRKLWLFYSEDCGYFIPKIVDILFGYLWILFFPDSLHIVKSRRDLSSFIDNTKRGHLCYCVTIGLRLPLYL